MFTNTASSATLTNTRGYELKQYTGSGWVTFDPHNGTLKYEGSKPQSLLPDEVFFQDKKGTVILKKGKKAHVVSTHSDDEYDRVYGFLLAFFQMNSGMSKKEANKYLQALRSKSNQDLKK